MNRYIEKRLVNHVAFIKDRMDGHGEPKGLNSVYGFPCVSNQENSLFIRDVEYVKQIGQTGTFESGYINVPQSRITHLWEKVALGKSIIQPFEVKNTADKKRKRKSSDIEDGNLFSSFG